MKTAREIRAMAEWGSFPCDMRRQYLAQGRRCPYCGKMMYPWLMRSGVRPTRDHVLPKSRGGRSTPGNVVLAHERCNSEKDSRLPRACELLFAAIALDVRRDFYLAPQEVVV